MPGFPLELLHFTSNPIPPAFGADQQTFAESVEKYMLVSLLEESDSKKKVELYLLTLVQRLTIKSENFLILLLKVMDKVVELNMVLIKNKGVQ